MTGADRYDHIAGEAKRVLLQLAAKHGTTDAPVFAAILRDVIANHVIAAASLLAEQGLISECIDLVLIAQSRAAQLTAFHLASVDSDTLSDVADAMRGSPSTEPPDPANALTAEELDALGLSEKEDP